ncbi:transcriptional regulator [Acrocarpospora pleiomorpha]|uniref:Transcriptional regulator n=1 Tax=Acrocarpospora pleiomorpha TaxID=90975 RepID=A0A5M3Y6Z1_9ACTN|nr:Lrp/AsnC family transcriptional regulator [Acrocarpospora pleiomorpha]GES27438.1 transcriptional regulator [Acrocarpospora pleiomorpha]
MTDALDSLDWSVIRALEEDGRRPFREIGRALGVSEATIRARVRRMQESGLLRIVAFTDPARVQSPYQLALVVMRVEPSRHEAIVEALSRHPEVSYVSTVMGRADILAEVLVRDQKQLWEIVSRKIRVIEGVVDAETMLIVEVHKLRYVLPNGEAAES